MDHYKNIQQQIDAYVKGTLSNEEIEALWVEFAKDPSLLDDLELEVGVKQLLASGLSTSGLSGETAPVRELPTWTWHAVAASVLVLIASLQIFNQSPKTELEDFLVQTIPADKIETSDGIRAKDMTITPADSLLNLGFSAAISGSTNEALRLYEKVIKNYDMEPYGSKAFLNKGIIQYNESEYEESITSFEQAIERVDPANKMIAEKTWWYLANAFVNVGNIEEALKATHQAYAFDGIYRKPAFLLYQKLNYDLGYTDYDDYESQVKQ